MAADMTTPVQAASAVERWKRLQAIWNVLLNYRLASGHSAADRIYSGNDKINLCNQLLDASLKDTPDAR